MKCFQCQFENPQGARFCNACGSGLEPACPACKQVNPTGSRFCNQCGRKLEPTQASGGPDNYAIQDSRPGSLQPLDQPIHQTAIGERKYVSVVFCDLSGYTAISRRLDPEEVKEMMGRIFGEIAGVIDKYGGFVEKYVGDAVMALFGVPVAHEDDPIRAVKTALEIHRVIRAISPEFEDRAGRPLVMHTGIYTGLVVTGELNVGRGTHGILGDTINMAARLSSQAAAGDILVGQETFNQTVGHFHFETLNPITVKGRDDPVPVFKVLSSTEIPRKVHRFQGLRSKLIARQVEFHLLGEAVQKAQKGHGSILTICGNAGTGKSRLLEEFKASLDPDQIQWYEGQCFPYAQNIPYFPIIDLLNHALHIEESDPPDIVQDKLETALGLIDEKKDKIIPYVGSLYNLSYPELEGISPDIWRLQFQKAINKVVALVARRALTVICLEDLHWADPSSLDLIRFLLADFYHPVIILCVHRPRITLFSSHQIQSLGGRYREIRLHDLSSSETTAMVKSLLQTPAIPSGMKRFLQDKVEGNPFYIEEMINSLTEEGTLVRESDGWVLKKSLDEAEISPTINGLITARMDRLDNNMKRILQEASVIGRTFFYDILNRVSELGDFVDQCLGSLEHLDLIKARALQPDLEYIFKHALTQEVVYGGLLKKQRRDIHERIGSIMEQLFKDRLPEYYETLAVHYKNGKSTHKAVEYLAKSGQKSLGHYALEEAHQYYRDAFNLLIKKQDPSTAHKIQMVDLLNDWAFVYYYRGRYKELLEKLIRYKSLADSLKDSERLGMYQAWLGCALWHRERFSESHEQLKSALAHGEETGNNRLIGYACTWLTWVCTELGLMDEAMKHGLRAQIVSEQGRLDAYVYFNSLAGMAYNYWHRGEAAKATEVGETLLKFGRDRSDSRIKGMGYCCIGWGHLADGDLVGATPCFLKAVKVSVDPWYSVFPKLALSYGRILDGKIQEAEQHIKEVSEFSQSCGAEFVGKPAHFFNGIALIADGQIHEGLQILEDSIQNWDQNDSRLRFTACSFILANIYMKLAQNADQQAQPSLASSATEKALSHFQATIDSAVEIGTNGTVGQAHLHLGAFYQAGGNIDLAGKHYSEALKHFAECGAGGYLQQARELLAGISVEAEQVEGQKVGRLDLVK